MGAGYIRLLCCSHHICILQRQPASVPATLSIQVTAGMHKTGCASMPANQLKPA